MNDASLVLNWVDYAIITIIGLSTLISLIRGFVREALSLAVWLMAFVIAFKFSSSLAPSLQSYITSETFRFAAAFSLLMVGSLIAGAIITHFISLLINKTGLSGTDRLLGVLFGICRGVFLVVILLMIGQMSNLQRQTWWASSQMIPQFMGLVNQLERLLPEQIAQFPAFLESKKQQLQQSTRGVTQSIPLNEGSGASSVIEDVKKTIENQTGAPSGGLPAIIKDNIETIGK